MLTLCAIPVGLALGYGMCALLVPIFDRELFRLPLVFGTQTFIYPTQVVAKIAPLPGASCVFPTRASAWSRPEARC